MKKASIELALCGPSQGRVLEQLAAAAYREREEIMTAENREAFMMLQVNAAAGRMHVILHKGYPVGFIAVLFFYSVREAGRCAMVEEFYLVPEHRNERIAIKSLEALLIDLDSFGIVAVHAAAAFSFQLTETLQLCGFEPWSGMAYRRGLGLDEDWD
ncbi:MAG: GNAT family N-acetyltransferase [Rhodobacteraceae bacterium]|nr:GNAT family N-acetyltransferase [Paracoccaceae bacterium]